MATESRDNMPTKTPGSSFRSRGPAVGEAFSSYFSHESTQATILFHRVSFEFADVRTFSSSLERSALHSSK
jgi:hypothetical protein